MFYCRFFILISLLFGTGNLFADFSQIDFTKIDDHVKYKRYYTYVHDNLRYYSTWSQEWNYDKSKPELISKLEEAYSAFSAAPKKDLEMRLLMGEVAHYLYNMDAPGYFDSATANFKIAARLAPADFRPCWFLANHLANGNIQDSSVEMFIKAQNMQPPVKPADFWEEYAFAMAIARMPGHALLAMDKIRTQTGKPGYFEKEIWPAVTVNIKDLDKDSNYTNKQIWTAENGDMATFSSRPLGIKLSVDTSWDINVQDYEHPNSSFVIKPTPLHNKKGREIGYTIAIIMKVGDAGSSLEAYTTSFFDKYPDKKRINTFNKYPNTVAYEIKDPASYESVGGGHMYVIGIERNAPAYPGYALESAISMPKQAEGGGVHYFRPAVMTNRFTGRIRYLIILDSCEDIHDQSFNIFKTFFDKQLVIE